MIIKFFLKQEKGEKGRGEIVCLQRKQIHF